MNVILWILQVLLALHTVTGAIWKFSNSEQSIPSLQALPHALWLTLIAVELLSSIGLIVPAFRKSLRRMPAIAAGCIAGEMVLFSAFHLQSGQADHGPMIYWLVVAALAILIVVGRLRPAQG
jgi:hypothetical protein